jgi:hypothetical protein
MPSCVRSTDILLAMLASSTAIMANSKIISADSANQKNKGTKNFKKAEKEKTQAKRAAAAEMAKANKTARVAVYVVAKKEAAPVQEEMRSSPRSRTLLRSSAIPSRSPSRSSLTILSLPRPRSYLTKPLSRRSPRIPTSTRPLLATRSCLVQWAPSSPLSRLRPLS